MNGLSGLEHDEIRAVLKSFSEATNWAVCDRPKQAESRAESRNDVPSPHLPQSKMSRRWRLVETAVQDGIADLADLGYMPSVPMDSAQELLVAIERLVDRLDLAEETVRRQEAELATSVGVTNHSDRQRETADRLESILDSVSRAIGAVAGAIYLLDDETSSLKLRSSIGLPKSRLTCPPRDLRGSLADLEALLGNAVLLNDIELMRDWPSPEPFASALVVPIGSSTMPHGTMWFWSENTRSYSPTEVEVANLAAGRVMSEIEQSILGQEVHQSRVIQKQFDTASVTQASLLPNSQILNKDFDVNGWTFQNGSGDGYSIDYKNPVAREQQSGCDHANDQRYDVGIARSGLERILGAHSDQPGNGIWFDLQRRGHSIVHHFASRLPSNRDSGTSRCRSARHALFEQPLSSPARRNFTLFYFWNIEQIDRASAYGPTKQISSNRQLRNA